MSQRVSVLPSSPRSPHERVVAHSQEVSETPCDNLDSWKTGFCVFAFHSKTGHRAVCRDSYSVDWRPSYAGGSRKYLPSLAGAELHIWIDENNVGAMSPGTRARDAAGGGTCR